MVHGTRARPNLHPVVLPGHPNQILQNTHADTLLDKTWQPLITRPNKDSRGLQHFQRLDYVVAGVQELLHLPGFMNWVNTHNIMVNGAMQNPCHGPGFMYHPHKACMFCGQPNIYNRPDCVICNGPFALYPCPTCNHPNAADREICAVVACRAQLNNPSHDPIPCPRCIACDMEDLIAEYWGAVSMRADGTPSSLPPNGSIMPILDYANKVRYRGLRGFPYDRPDRVPDLFVMDLIDDIHQSSPHAPYGHPVPSTIPWSLAFEALFATKYESFVECRVCHRRQRLAPWTPGRSDSKLSWELPLDPSNNPHGIPIYPPHSFVNVLDRAINGADQAIICPNCPPGINRGGDLIHKITAAPEYVIIQLDLYDPNTHQMHTGALDIPMDLDLRQYQLDTSTNLKYKLTAVARHHGDIVNDSQWFASVKGPHGQRGVFTIDGPNTGRQPANTPGFFLDNPQDYPHAVPPIFPDCYAGSCLIYTRHRPRVR